MPSGFQDYWITGSHMYFKRDDDALGNKFPWLDLGVVEVFSPQLNPAKAQLFDADGGIQRLVDERITKIDEVYTVKSQNLNLDNLALIFLANPAAAASPAQNQTEFDVQTHVFPGRLSKIVDASGNPVLALDAIAGVYTGAIATKVVTDIVAATKTITFSGDQTGVAALAAGKAFILQKNGLTNIANSRSYTVVTRTLNAGHTDIVVAETPAGNESAIAGQATVEGGGTVYKQDTDWNVASLDRGFIRAISGGAISVEQDVHVIYTTTALTGSRIINPQSLKGLFRGQMIAIWGRNNNSEQSGRYAKVSLLPKSASMSVQNYSDVEFDVTVLADLTQTVPAGFLNYFKGALPSAS